MTDKNHFTWSVVLPVYKESPESVASLVEDLETTWDEVIITADTPSDPLKTLLQDLSTTTNVELVCSSERRGKGRAIRDGLSHASGDVIGYVDADGAVPAADLRQLFESVTVSGSSGPDVAVGSRHLPSTSDSAHRVSSRSGQSPSRRVLGQTYSVIGRLLSRATVSDFQCGAKAFTKEAWTEVAPHITIDGFGFDTQLLNQFAIRDYTIREHGIDWHDPGNTSVSVTSTIPHMLYTLFTVWTTTLLSLTPGISVPEGSAGKTEIALVSSHPPNQGHLSEYGKELAQSYTARNDLTVTVHTNVEGWDAIDNPHSTPVLSDENTPYQVCPSWERDSLSGAFTLCKTLFTADYDVIHFNVHMTYFGDSNFHRFLGLALPAVLNLKSDSTVVTTLHDMLEIVDEGQLDDEIGLLERIGATIATQIVLLSEITTVTSERYKEILSEKYYPYDLRHVPHGTFVTDTLADTDPAPNTNTYRDLPPSSTLPNPSSTLTDGGATPQLLVFGHLSPIKDIKTAVEAFSLLRDRYEGVELVIAGGSHPDYEGYQEQLVDEHGDVPGIRFTGYVPEGDLESIWTSATLLLMPYRTITGVSGVYQLAKTYGVPVVASDIPGMREATVETGGDAEFVSPSDPYAVAETIDELFQSPERLAELGAANNRVADEFTIADAAETVVSLAQNTS